MARSKLSETLRARALSRAAARLRVPEPRAVIDPLGRELARIQREALEEFVRVARADWIADAADRPTIADTRRVIERIAIKIGERLRASRIVGESAKRTGVEGAKATKKLIEQSAQVAGQKVDVEIGGAWASQGRRVATIRISSQVPAAEIDDFLKRTTSLITNTSRVRMREVASIVRGGFGKRWEDLAPRVQEVMQIGERRAKLIARDQVLKTNANLNESRFKRLGIKEYIWATSKDGVRVRSNHRELDGRRFKFSEPPIGGGTGPTDAGNPGSGIWCRCQALPVIPDFDE